MKKITIRPSSSFLLCAFAFAASQTATATDGRYREYVIGERAGGMGGAALATAIDVDAIYYNPAGLAKSRGNNFSLSANLYGVERYKTEKGLDWGSDADSSSIVSIPAAMGGVNRISDEWVSGFGVFTPKMEKRHLVSASPDRTGFTHFDYDDQTLWMGAAAAWKPADSRFSLGFGIFAVYRDYSETASSFMRNGYSVNQAMDIQTLGALAMLGVQADFDDGWSAGVAVQTPTIRLWDDGKFSFNGNGSFAGIENADLGFYTTDVRADNHIPLQLAAGVAKAGKNWSVALDAIWHSSSHYDLARWNINGNRLDQTIKLRSVLDVSLGAEYIVAEHYPIRAGFYTAMSGVRLPDDTESADFVSSDVDMYGVTFSVGRSGKNTCVNIGLDVATGSGHDLQYVEDGSMIRVDSDRVVTLLTVSTTYYF